MGSDDKWGGIALEAETVSRVWLPFTLLRFALTFIVAVAVPLVVAMWTVPMDPIRGAIAGAAFLVYLVVGYVVRPRPNHDNLGIAHGLIDHPFTIGDDWNRWLWSVQWMLFPGYFLARPVVEMFFWLAGEAEET